MPAKDTEKDATTWRRLRLAALTIWVMSAAGFLSLVYRLFTDGGVSLARGYDAVFWWSMVHLAASLLMTGVETALAVRRRRGNSSPLHSAPLEGVLARRLRSLLASREELRGVFVEGFLSSSTIAPVCLWTFASLSFLVSAPMLFHPCATSHVLATKGLWLAGLAVHTWFVPPRNASLLALLPAAAVWLVFCSVSGTLGTPCWIPEALACWLMLRYLSRRLFGRRAGTVRFVALTERRMIGASTESLANGTFQVLEHESEVSCTEKWEGYELDFPCSDGSRWRFMVEDLGMLERISSTASETFQGRSCIPSSPHRKAVLQGAVSYLVPSLTPLLVFLLTVPYGLDAYAAVVNALAGELPAIVRAETDGAWNILSSAAARHPAHPDVLLYASLTAAQRGRFAAAAAWFERSEYWYEGAEPHPTLSALRRGRYLEFCRRAAEPTRNPDVAAESSRTQGWENERIASAKKLVRLYASLTPPFPTERAVCLQAARMLGEVVTDGGKTAALRARRLKLRILGHLETGFRLDVSTPPELEAARYDEALSILSEPGVVEKQSRRTLLEALILVKSSRWKSLRALLESGKAKLLPAALRKSLAAELARRGAWRGDRRTAAALERYALMKGKWRLDALYQRLFCASFPWGAFPGGHAGMKRFIEKCRRKGNLSSQAAWMAELAALPAVGESGASRVPSLSDIERSIASKSRGKYLRFFELPWPATVSREDLESIERCRKRPYDTVLAAEAFELYGRKPIRAYFPSPLFGGNHQAGRFQPAIRWLRALRKRLGFPGKEEPR